MRTTLTIDDDILATVKAIARQEGKTMGAVISDLARRTLHPTRSELTRNGVPLLPVCKVDTHVTPEIVNALRDELP